MNIKLEEVELFNLKHKPEYIEEVSKLYWSEWSKVHGDTIDGVIYRTKHCLNENDIPQTYIALYKTKLVGIFSLWRNDLCSRQDLFPWMAGLYVNENYRNCGIGMYLQNNAISITKKLGYTKLYLITEHDNYYEKNNWIFLEEAPLGNGNFTKIYFHNLDN